MQLDKLLFHLLSFLLTFSLPTSLQCYCHFLGLKGTQER